MKLIEHRAFVPANLPNKTRAAIDALSWVKSGWGGTSAHAKISTNLSKPYDWEYDLTTGCMLGYSAFPPVYTDPVEPFVLPYNAFDWEWTYNGLSNEPPLGNAGLAVRSSASFGFPDVLQRLPDGCTIEAAVCEVMISNLTRKHTILPYPGTGEMTIDESVEGVSALWLEFYRDGTYGTIGAFGAGGGNKWDVVDCTAVIQHIYNARHSVEVIGFGTICLPTDIGDGLGGQALLEAVLGEPPDFFYPPLGDPPVSQSCFAAMTKRESDEIHWGGVSLGQLRIKVGYPAGDSLDVVTPRWPVMD